MYGIGFCRENSKFTFIAFFCEALCTTFLKQQYLSACGHNASLVTVASLVFYDFFRYVTEIYMQSDELSKYCAHYPVIQVAKKSTFVRVKKNLLIEEEQV